MRVLYAMQGTGNGHVSRALEIIPILQQKAEVDILISGHQYKITLPYKVKYQLNGLGFVFGKKGGIDYLKTLKNFKFFNFYKEIKQMPIQNYNLIINDFEPVTAWAAKLKNVPIISISHQNAVLDKCSPNYKKNSLQKYILKYYAPAKIKFGFHFKSYNSSIFTPIIRKQIRDKKISNKGHYTVYLPSYSDKKIIEILSKFPIVKWQVFSSRASSHQYKKNITIQPIDNFDFIKSLASSEGVICGAGFETPAEALFLGKKLMVIPMKNQYEQQCNTVALKEMGVTVIKKLSSDYLQQIAFWIQSNPTINVHYPDITEEILETIILLNYNVNSLTTI